MTLPTSRRRALILSGLCATTLGLGSAAMAQTDWQQDAVPFYDTTQALQGVYAHWAHPAADAFAQQTQALPVALRAHCSATPATTATAATAAVAVAAPTLNDARQAWRGSMLAFEALSAVSIGPLVTRRSQRQIDFTPTRPALIERAIKAQPTGAKAFERVGTPAKGLPALEWLLWTQPVAPGTPACHYAMEVALDIEREATALKADFTRASTTNWDAEEEQEQSARAMSEFINQWVGGIERLRWAHMEKPLRAAQNGHEPAYPRSASGQTAAAWAAEWHTLRALTVLPKGQATPAPGAALVPLESYLRGRGLNPLAQRTVEVVGAIDTAMTALTQAGPGRHETLVMNTARALAQLKRLAEADIAPALEISIGFSDADGD